MRWKIKDLTGKRFGSLIALKMYGRNDAGQILWSCICDCGKKKVIRGVFLSNGETISCGCANKGNLIHGLSRNPIYSLYIGIKKRCFNKRSNTFKNYGGRGISICEEWNNDFIAFYNWCLDNGYKKGLQIDRVNNEGNYEPINCRFVTSKVNSRNTRRNVLITYKGETKCISEWADLTGINRITLYGRFRKHGNSDTLFIKPKPQNK